MLYDRPFDDKSLAEDWQIRGGEWQMRDGWLRGNNPLNSPGMVTSRQSFPGNVMLEFEARTVLPSTHDINWMWNGSWNEATNTRAVAYVAGLQGWWEGKVGFEKSPDYKLNVGTPLFPFEPGRTYRILSGSADGHCFVVVDGRLVLEVTDPEPIERAAVRHDRFRGLRQPDRDPRAGGAAGQLGRADHVVRSGVLRLRFWRRFDYCGSRGRVRVGRRSSRG